MFLRQRQQLIDLFAHPDGRGSEPMALILNFFNRHSNAAVPEALELEPGEDVLEIGFGGGAGIEATLAALGDESVLYAVDLSHGMVERARIRFARQVDSGQLRLYEAPADHLPLPSGFIDAAYAVHSHMYWPSVEEGLREMARVLRPGGRAMLAMDELKGLRLLDKSYSHVSDPAWLAAEFEAAGFLDTHSTSIAKGKIGVFGRVRAR